MLGGRVRWCRGDSGQASLLLLGVVTLLLGLAVVLFAFGSALGSKGKHQRAADLAAVSAGQVMRNLYPRLFEPPVLANGLPNPRHLPLPVYLALVRRAAVRGARRNGVEVRGAEVFRGKEGRTLESAVSEMVAPHAGVQCPGASCAWVASSRTDGSFNERRRRRARTARR